MSDNKHLLKEQDQDALYEKAEMDLLRAGLNRSLKERFLMTTTLYKIQQTFRKARITHKPYSVAK